MDLRDGLISFIDRKVYHTDEEGQRATGCMSLKPKGRCSSKVSASVAANSCSCSKAMPWRNERLCSTAIPVQLLPVAVASRLLVLCGLSMVLFGATL